MNANKLLSIVEEAAGVVFAVIAFTHHGSSVSYDAAAAAILGHVTTHGSSIIRSVLDAVFQAVKQTPSGGAPVA